jgi:2-aminoethylphosphonate dioxygenase
MKSEGYRFLPGALDGSTVAWLRQAVDELGHLAERSLGKPGSALIVVPEVTDPALVCRYEHIMGAEPRVRERLLATVLPIIEESSGERLRLFKDKVNNKHPGGGAFRPHQDIVAYKCFAPRYHVTVMITIDPATERNGCLFVAHEYRTLAERRPELVTEVINGLPVFRHYWGTTERHGDILAEVESEFTWRALPTTPADLLVFDSFLPHFSYRNESEDSRRAMFLTFSRVAEGDWYGQYYEEKRRAPADPKFHVSTPTSMS